jgi:methylase of polypeptide subunit release factors
MAITRELGFLLSSAALRAYRSRRLAQVLFPMEFSPAGPRDYYFDVTTIALVRAVARDVTRTHHVLDMGCGAHAVIGVSLWKKTGCAVTCCDINPDLVDLARASAAKNQAPIDVVRSEFFADVPGQFDTVVFNPPYVPTRIGETQATRRSQWDGGRDGTRVVDAFLGALERIEKPVLVFIGVNSFFVSTQRMIAMLDERPSLRLDRTNRSSILPVDVHVIQKAGHD